jgi:hypothetical protein
MYEHVKRVEASKGRSRGLRRGEPAARNIFWDDAHPAPFSLNP